MYILILVENINLQMYSILVSYTRNFSYNSLASFNMKCLTLVMFCSLTVFVGIVT